MALATALRRGVHGPLLRPSGTGAGIATARRPIAAALATEVVDTFKDRDLLSYASAIAYQVVFTTLPVVLVGLAAMGFLGLSETWTIDGAPRAREALAADTFSVVDRTVRSILTEKQALWLTVGLALTLFKVSSVIRVTASALNRLYELEEDRSLLERLVVSLLAAAVVLPCGLVGVGGVLVGGEVSGVLGVDGVGAAAVWTLRWAVVVAVLLGLVFLVLRLAPASRPPVHHVSLGAGIVVAGWVAATLLYGLYATEIASYGSVFGSLASVVVLITYAWILAAVFLAGVSVDMALRRRMGDDDRVAS